jgi:conjugal transfer pilus assembly protein TraK
MDEQAFASDGVRAVAIFPNAILDKGQSTSVFVMADKAATGGK